MSLPTRVLHHRLSCSSPSRRKPRIRTRVLCQPHGDIGDFDIACAGRKYVEATTAGRRNPRTARSKCHAPACSRGRARAPRRARLAISDDRSAERSIADQLFDVSTSQRRTACSACGRRSCTKTATACTHSSASRKACAAQSQSGSQRLRVCTKYWPPDGEYTRYSPGAHWRTTHRHAFGNRAAGTGAQVHGVGIGGDLHARRRDRSPCPASDTQPPANLRDRRDGHILEAQGSAGPNT